MAAESSARHRDPTLVERLCDRQRDGWRRGERPLVEALAAGDPALADDREGLLELICNEMELRAAAGEAPRLEEYQQRFPHLADDLRKQFEVFAALGAMDARGFPAAGGEPDPSDAAPVPPPTASPAPEVEGYAILGLLGQGGMGIVYKARQTAAGRVVALKMILGGFADEEARARFRTEARAAARLQHPNVVQVFEVGEHRGAPFFSLEFCAGGGLDARLRAAPLPPAEAARLVEALARAVQHAHERGVVHRDLKPANVLLTEDGAPKIADFGLARKLDEPGRTETGAILGSAPYMAPEQASGESKAVGPATDVYALGAILYECLTGRPPFKAATTLETLVQVRNDDPVPPRRLQPKAPRDLETVCLKCLQKDPKRRYTTAAGLAEDLRRFRAGEPIAARPAGRLERTWRWARRNPKDAALIAAGLLAAVLAAVAYLWVAGDRRDRQAQATARAEGLLAEAELLWEQARATPAGDLVPWAKALDAARRAREMIAANPVDDPTRRRGEQVWADVAAAEQQAERRKEEADRDERMKAELRKLAYLPMGIATHVGTVEEAADALFARPNAEYERAFRTGYGIDLSRMEEAEFRIRASAIRPQLVAALDAWVPLRPDARARHELADLADRLSEPDEFRHALRQALADRDLARLGELVRRDLSALPLPALRDAAFPLVSGGDFEAAESLLWPAHQRYPGDFDVNEMLGYSLLRDPTHPRPAEAVRFCTAAVALQPENGFAHGCLGLALEMQGDREEAVAEYREAVRLAPNEAFLRLALGSSLHSQGKLGEAVAELRTGMRLGPAPQAAEVRFVALGPALSEQGRLDEAIAEYREALKLRPDSADGRSRLGSALFFHGDFREALAEYRQARELCAAGDPLLDRLGPMVRSAEEVVQEEGRLTALLEAVGKGEAQPIEASETDELAYFCLYSRRYAASARFRAEAFAAEPSLAPSRRDDAAHAAALAGCGRGEDAKDLTDPERARWRKQALDWLRAELDCWSAKAVSDRREDRQAAARQFHIWQCHVDFAGVRDEAALNALPPDEQASWRQFWADVAATAGRAEKR